MIRDIRFAIRFLRRDASTSALIIVVLAVGIAGNTAMFTLMKKALLDPLPYRDSGQLVTVVDYIYDKRISGGVNVLNPTVSEFLELRERSRVLEQLAAIDHRDFQLTGMGDATPIIGARVTSSFFTLLGVRPSLGRTFSAEERVVVLTDGLWRNRMGADPNVLGRTLRLNGEPHVVIGVLPRDFDFEYPGLRLPGFAEIYLPLPADTSSAAQSRIVRGQSPLADGVRVLARIRSGFGLKEAAADLDRIVREVYPPEYRRPGGGDTDRTTRPVPLREAIIGNQRSLLWLLMTGVGVLLLIACVNSAQILLARSLQRAREAAIRTALGAGRMVLIRQFMMEGLVPAACAGLLGIVLSRWIVRLIAGVIPARNPLFDSAQIDVYVLVFTIAVSFASAFVFGIVPAFSSSTRVLSLRLNTQVSIGRGNRSRNVMMAMEAALSVVLLCGAGLLAYNVWSLMSRPMGFDPRSTSLFQLRLLAPQQDGRAAVYQEYMRQIAAIPDIDSAAVATAIPLRPGNGGFNKIVGQPPEALANSRPAWTYFVSPNYFRTIGIPLIVGRTFQEDDSVGRPLVAVVNREFVRSHGLGANPIGNQIDDGPGGYIVIVGVVDDVRVRGNDITPEPQLYLAYQQFYQPNIYILVRSTLPRVQLTARVKAAIRSSNADQPILSTTMDQVLSNSISGPRFNSLLIGAFALLALVIAAIGMYSVVACLVSQRTNEIALRIALGAGRPAIVKTVMGATVVWVLGGLGAGLGITLAGADAFGRLTGMTVSGTPAVYGAVLLLFLVVTFAAVIKPLRRAMHVDPAIALKAL